MSFTMNCFNLHDWRHWLLVNRWSTLLCQSTNKCMTWTSSKCLHQMLLTPRITWLTLLSKQMVQMNREKVKCYRFFEGFQLSVMVDIIWFWLKHVFLSCIQVANRLISEILSEGSKLLAKGLLFFTPFKKIFKLVKIKILPTDQPFIF